MRKTNDTDMREAIERRWRLILITYQIVLAATLTVLSTAMWKGIGRLEEISIWRARMEEWRNSYKDYPPDAADFRRQMRLEIADERAVQFERLLNKLEGVQTAIRSIELEFREFRARHERTEQ